MRVKLLCVLAKILLIFFLFSCNESDENASSDIKKQAESSKLEVAPEDLYEECSQLFLEYEQFLLNDNKYFWADEYSYSVRNVEASEITSLTVYEKSDWDYHKEIDENGNEVDVMKHKFSTTGGVIRDLFFTFLIDWGDALDCVSHPPFYCELFYKEFDGVKIPYKFIRYGLASDEHGRTFFGKSNNYTEYEILDAKMKKDLPFWLRDPSE